jgi:hypothetical protein
VSFTADEQREIDDAIAKARAAGVDEATIRMEVKRQIKGGETPFDAIAIVGRMWHYARERSRGASAASTARRSISIMEAATTPTATDTPAEPAEVVGEAPAADIVDAADNKATDDERDESGRYLSREAASYRRRLRETESERDSLRERLDRLQTAEVERIAADAGLQVASDVWSFGASLDTLRGESGDIDAESVSGLVAEIVKDRPGLQTRPAGDVGIGRGGAAAAREPKVGLSALLKPEGR